MTDVELKAARKRLLAATVANLEGALPPGTPPRPSGRRAPEHVLAAHLTEDELAGPLADVQGGAGGELRPTAKGNLAFCSAESSALMAVNFLAPFSVAEDALLGVTGGGLRMERELRVMGVRAPVGPTLDAIRRGERSSVAIEAKVAEPWRAAPKVLLQQQYDAPAGAVSPGTLRTLAALRSGDLPYRCLDAAQLLKHLLGIHSALRARTLTAPATLAFVYWRPSDAGVHAPLLDLLEAELDDFARQLADQDVAITRRSTSRLLGEWSSASAGDRLREHAAALRDRYDRPLS